MKPRFGVALALLVVPILLAARPVAPVDHFQVTLERTAKGWSAACDTGCTWTEVSVACADDCRVHIDAAGISADDRRTKTDAAFGFVVSREAKGWQAESAAGTAWSKIGWGCPAGRCRVRINELGVTAFPSR